MIMTSSLPPALSDAIPGITWPLDPALTPPLYFESLEQMKSIRASSTQGAITAIAPSTSLLELLQDIPGTVEKLFPRLLGPAATGGIKHDDDEQDKRYFGLISMALVLLGHGYTDECHNLITPLSWPDDIHFAYGPSVYSQVSPAARSYATYVHCLVHRREAYHVGEFGMVGFQNGNFWSNAVATSPGVDSLPHAELLSRVATLAEEDYPDSPSVQDWCKRHGMTRESQLSLSSSPFFESRAVHQLCATVLQQQQQQQQQQKSSTSTHMDKDKLQLKAFAEQVAESEIRILLAHSLEKAGFGKVDTMTSKRRSTTSTTQSATSFNNTQSSTKIASTKVIVDVDIAIGASRRVSSAHLGIFQSTGAVTLRRVLGGHDDNSEKTTVLSATAGVACRLLEAPACRLVPQNELFDGTDGDIVEIVVSSGKVLGQVDHGNAAGGGDLALGDVLACLLNNSRGQCSGSSSSSPGYESYVFTSVLADDHAAVFVDPLFGSRGETPTTVVEWSKGTIHY